MNAIDLKEGELLMQRNKRILAVFLYALTAIPSLVLLLHVVILIEGYENGYPVHVRWKQQGLTFWDTILITLLSVFLLGILSEKAKELWKLSEVYFFHEYLLVSRGSEYSKITFEDLDYFTLNKNSIQFAANSSKHKEFKGYKFRLNPSHEHHAAALVEFLNSKIIRNHTNDNV